MCGTKDGATELKKKTTQKKKNKKKKPIYSRCTVSESHEKIKWKYSRDLTQELRDATCLLLELLKEITRKNQKSFSYVEV